MSMHIKRKNKLRFTHVFSDSKKHPFEQVDWDEYGLSRGIVLRKLINRVVKKYSRTGQEDNYFATIKDKNIFERELIWLVLNQVIIFENDVWFSVGEKSSQKSSKSAIVGVENSGDSRFDCLSNIISVLQNGSDVGVNLSKICSSEEGQSTSGPIGFLQLVNNLTKNFTNEKIFILDVDHPDILDFIKCSYSLVNSQTKICVRVSDDFMKSVENDTDFNLRSRKTGKPIETINAKKIFNEIILASSNNFSLQFDTTINAWQTTPLDGKISASNPSGEFLTSNSLECPRVMIDLSKFISGKRFDFEKYISAVEIAATALDISVGFCDFSTTHINSQTKKSRPIGVSFTNLDVILEKFKLSSRSARVFSASIADLTSAVAYRRSAELSVAVGNSERLKNNLKNQRDIVKKHYEESLRLTDKVVDEMKLDVNINELIFAANLEWDIALDFSKKFGFRNCQLTLLSSDRDFILEKTEQKNKQKPIDQIKIFSGMQPFITGGIGTPIIINDENVEQIEEMYFFAWKHGLKSVTFCKNEV